MSPSVRLIIVIAALSGSLLACGDDTPMPTSPEQRPPIAGSPPPPPERTTSLVLGEQPAVEHDWTGSTLHALSYSVRQLLRSKAHGFGWVAAPAGHLRHLRL